jgi:hypothetical protein
MEKFINNKQLHMNCCKAEDGCFYPEGKCPEAAGSNSN